MTIPKYIHPERILKLNQKNVASNGKYVALWV